jgi:hypothetical protein
MAPNPPAEFLCPITKKLMREPMVNRYGIHYEKKAILDWLQEGNNYCPVTTNPLRPSGLIHDKTLQWKIQYWASKNGCADEAKASDEEEPIILGFAVVPEKFKCPLTNEIMEDPVVSKFGDSFERKAIKKWMDEMGNVCPVTKQKLEPGDLVTDAKLQADIRQWQLSSGSQYEEMDRLELEGKLSKAIMISQDFHMVDILKALTEAEAAERGADGKPAAEEKENDDEDVLGMLDDVIDTVDVEGMIG